MTLSRYHVVYDCVVFAHALISPGGPSGECVNRARRGEVLLFVSDYLVDEIRGLPAWKDAFQVMRRNCETDWAQRYPQYVVSEWVGHDITVSATHYLQVPEELFRKAAGIIIADDVEAVRPQLAPNLAPKPPDTS